MYYTWITDKIAIGELNVRYDNFDTIVNLAYINPSFNRGLEHRHIRSSHVDGKHVIEVGLWDSDVDGDYIEIALKTVFNILSNSNDSNDLNILFHCQSGKSRSVTFAIAYLCLKNNLSFDDALEIIKTKRPVINPRPLFLQKVAKYIENSRNI